ncbi:4-hydroxy-tetrahydrodipicolinate reductase [soil metagenome]
MISITICGITGRMGSTLVRLAGEHADLRVVGGIGRTGADVAADIAVATVDNPAAALEGADVVIDFSTASATRALVDRAADQLAGRALVIGTTGLDAATQELIDRLAQRAAVLTAANFSVGVNLLEALCERVSAALDAAAYDVEIVEAHHARKVDAPSCTALVLAEAVARGRAQTLADVRRDGRTGETGARPTGEIGMHAIRGGDIVGEHSVLFIGSRERIELRHAAQDRALFADGALTAARWLAGRAPGRYTMRDVLDL